MKQRYEIALEHWQFLDEESVEASSSGDSVLDSLKTEKWQDVSLPHDWAATRPCQDATAAGNGKSTQGYVIREGVGWYRHILFLAEKSSESDYVLMFDGVYEQATVWVNETEVATHGYGYTGFKVDITEQLHAGRNVVVVRVDNAESKRGSRWYSGCGIYRKVILRQTPREHLVEEEIFIQSEVRQNESAQLRISGLPQAEVTVRLLWAGEEVATDTGRSGTLTLEVPEPRLWCAETPNLYELNITLLQYGVALDEVCMKVGLRSIRFSANEGLFVNGVETKLKGVCLHHDGGCVGAAVTRNLWRQKLSVLKKLGCNAIRMSHNPPSLELLELCDELGFYVIDESFDAWDKNGSYARFFDKDWEEDLSFMVLRDRNHPAVILWSVGNEVPGMPGQHHIDILGKLIAKVRSLDPSRPVSCALAGEYHDDSGEFLSTLEKIIPYLARVAALVDVLMLNYQEQWFDQIHEQFPEKLIISSEAYAYYRRGDQGWRGFAGDPRNPWLATRVPHVIGSFIWAGVDYLGEASWYPSKGWTGSLIRSNLEPRPVAHLLESFWSDQPRIHIAMVDESLPEEYTQWHWGFPPLSHAWKFPEDRRRPVPFQIFTNCTEIRLIQNGQPRDVRQLVEFPDGVISGSLEYIPGTILVEGLRDGAVVCTHELKTAQDASFLEFLTQEALPKDDGVQQILLTVVARDKDGTRCFRENRLVWFEVEGGDIEGVDNGRMLCTESMHSRQIHMHEGAASVVVRLKKRNLTVRAFSEGLNSGIISLF